MRTNVHWHALTVTPRYSAVLLGAGPMPDPTHTLHVYGFRDTRERIIEHASAGLTVRPVIVNHRRPWTRAVLIRAIHEPVRLNPELGWQHAAFMFAVIFALTILAYNIIVPHGR